MSRPHRLTLLLAVLPLLAGSLLMAASASAEERLQLVATTGMVADVLREIGGDRVEVRGLMGPGVDPHLYARMFPEITPQAMLGMLADKEMKAGTYEFMDKTAIQIIGRSMIKTVIFNGENPENLKKAVKDELGTVIMPNK